MSENVTRPIVNGVVIAFSQPKPTPDEIGKREIISWTDVANISENGTFEFASLPASGRLQLIAVCREWVIVDQQREGKPKRGNAKQGVLLDLGNRNIKSNLLDNVVLELEPAGALDVTVVDVAGTPIPDITVNINPNQMLEDAGFQILGAGYASLTLLRGLWDPEFNSVNYWDSNRQTRYSQKTDSNGKATIYSVPVGGQHMLSAGSDKFQMADNAEQPERMMRVGFDKPESKQVTIVVERIPETK